MWKHVLVQGCYQLFWLFFFMYALPTFQWQRYWLTDHCTLMETGPVSKPIPDYCLGLMMTPPEAGSMWFNATAAAPYCDLLTQCGWPCGDEFRGGAECAAAVAAAGGGAFAPGAVPSTEWGALCPGVAAGSGHAACPLYAEFRRVQQFWEARHEKQEELDFKRLDSLLFNSFIFLQVRFSFGS